MLLMLLVMLVLGFFYDSNPLNLHECLTVAKLRAPSFLPGETLAIEVRWLRSSNEIFTRC